MDFSPTEKFSPGVRCPLNHVAELVEGRVWCARCGTFSEKGVVRETLRVQLGSVPKDLIDRDAVRDLGNMMGFAI